MAAQVINQRINGEVVDFLVQSPTSGNHVISYPLLVGISINQLETEAALYVDMLDQQAADAQIWGEA